MSRREDPVPPLAQREVTRHPTLPCCQRREPRAADRRRAAVRTCSQNTFRVVESNGRPWGGTQTTGDTPRGIVDAVQTGGGGRQGGEQKFLDPQHRPPSTGLRINI